MASGKAAGPSGIVAEMLKPVGETGAVEVRDLIEDIISEGCIPTDWQESFIVNLYRGKGDALNRGNYRGLKLIEQVMKVLELVVEGLIRQRVKIDEMQCGFMSGRGTTDAIFIVRQLQKHLAANKPLYMAFVNLEKAFDRVPRDVIWWAMRKLGIDEWLVRLVQSMYKDVRSTVRVGDGYSEEFGVGVGVHQGSVLSPLLFIIVLEALSREFRTGCPWELLYADDLMISAESMEELLVKVQTWKTEMEKKGLRVNMGKTKIMESGINLDVLKKSAKYFCGVCQSGVGSSNAIFCGGCKRWVHKKCSGIKGPLRPDPEFRCARCLGTARAIDEREVSEAEVGNEKLEVVPDFCYLGDMLSAGGGCELAAITRCKCAWGKFRQLLPLLTNCHLPLLTRGKVYSSCVRSVMLHAAETWAMKVDTLNRLRRNDRAMIRWICNVRARDEVSSDSLLTKLGIQDLRCGAPHQEDEMVWTCRAQHRLDCRSKQAECGCTEKIWKAKEIMGWSA